MLIKLVIAAFSMILGHIITRFLDRARPLLVIETFSTATKGSTEVICSDEISDLSKKSWATGTVLAGEVEWSKLRWVYNVSVSEIKSLDGAEKHAEKIINLLNKTHEKNDINDAIKEIFEHPGMKSILEMMFLRDKISSASKKYEEEIAINGFLHPDKDGCYIIVFNDAIGKIGKKLNIDEWRQEKLKPLFEAIKHHDKDLLINFLKAINSHVKDQRDIHIKLKELLTPMREDETIWIAHCSLANYGKSPLVVHPEAELFIIRPDGNREEPISCYVSAEEMTEDGLDAKDLKGPKILPTNSEIKIWVITKEKKCIQWNRREYK